MLTNRGGKPRGARPAPPADARGSTPVLDRRVADPAWPVLLVES